MNSSTKRLLAFLAVLLTVKIIILPIVDWQNEQVEILRGHEKRIGKAKAIIEEQQALQKALEDSESVLSAVEKQFPRFINSEVFRLETQKRFEVSVADNGLEIQQVLWRDNEDVQVSGNLYRAKLSLRMYGELNHFLQWQLALEQNQLGNQVKGLALQLRGATTESAGNFKGLVSFDVYYFRGNKK